MDTLEQYRLAQDGFEAVLAAVPADRWDAPSALITDTVTHAWDIGHALDMTVELDPKLVGTAFDWGRQHVIRRPGFFGPEPAPPADADEQTQMLAYLGRAAWQPVPA